MQLLASIVLTDPQSIVLTDPPHRLFPLMARHEASRLVPHDLAQESMTSVLLHHTGKFTARHENCCCISSCPSRCSQPARPPHSIASSHNCVLSILLSEHRFYLNPPVSAEPSSSLTSVASFWSCSDHRFHPKLGPLATKQCDLFRSCNR